MTLSEIISSAHEDIEFSAGIISSAIKEKNIGLLRLNYDWTIHCYMTLGLLQWRNGQDPRGFFSKMLKSTQEGMFAMNTIDSSESRKEQIKLYESIYAAYLIGANHPPINIEAIDEHVRANAFFGNVLIGAADIADWPKHRDAIPPKKRTNLARRTNELYADLLAGQITPEAGVRLGESLWTEREDDDYFLDGGEGGGDENRQVVDYQLGAILKKIGSKVPTVHAWVW